MKYTDKEAKEKAKKYFNGDELASTTWLNKYAIKDEEGMFLESTPDDMHSRREVNQIEKLTQGENIKFYINITEIKKIPWIIHSIKNWMDVINKKIFKDDQLNKYLIKFKENIELLLKIKHYNIDIEIIENGIIFCIIINIYLILYRVVKLFKNQK